MARQPRPPVINDDARKDLEALTRSRNGRQDLAIRARALLLWAQGQGPVELARQFDVARRSLYYWRQRFEESGVDGLKDEPRSGRPRAMTSEKAKEILDATVHTIPREATHWSLRTMADHAKVTVHQVREVWLAAGLKPHRIANFKISADPNFAEKVRDVVGLYLSPPDNAVVLSVDEKTQIQALDRTQPMLQLRPGQVQRRTHDYVRHGTRSLYAAFDVATGTVMGRVTQRHRAKEFVDFLRQIDRATPEDLALHLIVDNSSTHSAPDVKRFLEQHPRFHMHFTPTSSSWLNAVESWFAQLERRALRRSVFTCVEELREELHRYITVHNEKLAKPFRWTKSAEAILEKVDRVRTSIGATTTQTGH